MSRILVTQAKWNAERFFRNSLPRLEASAEVVLNQGCAPMELDAVLNDCGNIDVIISGWGGCDLEGSDVFDKAPNVRLIGILGGGIATGHPEEGFKRGITYCNCPTAIGTYVAEFTLGLILSMNYEIPYHDNYVKKLKLDSPPDGTHKDRDGWLARGLSKSRVGILGSGSIARHMVAMLAPFKCDILMSDPYLAADDARQLGVRKVDIDTLMKESDVLTVHAAWTNETEGILSRAKLSLLKHNALVINTARMPIFDEQALFDELTSGRLRACLNLIPFNAMWHDDAIRDSRNVYLSCSTATVSDKTYSDMGDMIADDVLHFLSHRDLQHKVTPKMYARMT